MNNADSAYRPIEDYAIIGDCRSAALVATNGSIDWLCWPRFDSPSIFCGILDADRGGSFAVSPAEVRRTTRTYVGDTAVLETTFETDDATFVLTDCMSIASPSERRAILLPENELVRSLRCTRGAGDVVVAFVPRTGFAQANDPLVDLGPLGIRVTAGRGLFTLCCDTPLRVAPDRMSANARVRLAAGEAINLTLTYAAEGAAVLPSGAAHVRAAIDRTLACWNVWSDRTTYDGPYRTAVVRSAIVVRLLTYGPSGATVAAATTSLPEKLGGPNNWDYRYCWLRDASFTVRGWLALGHPDEAEMFTHWLLHATRLTQPRLKVLYDVFGGFPPRERTLDNLSGYDGARPVRTGNGADDQLQLDSYGEVVDAVWRVTRAGRKLGRAACGVLESFGKLVCREWREADAGIWEPRDELERRSHSLALSWTALDRLIDLQDRGDMRARYRELFARTRAEIRADLENHAYNEALGSYVSVLDGEELDATALLFGWCGFDDAGSARMRGTFAALMKKLSPGPGLLFRNATAGDDGAFGICSFWIAEHLAHGGGTLAEARAAFEAALAYANDVGLFAEQVEPGSGRALGNTPQTFSHVGLINAAISIAERDAADRAAKPENVR